MRKIQVNSWRFPKVWSTGMSKRGGSPPYGGRSQNVGINYFLTAMTSSPRCHGVRTVPSSFRDAPCPVSTPSPFWSLARRCPRGIFADFTEFVKAEPPRDLSSALLAIVITSFLGRPLFGLENLDISRLLLQKIAHSGGKNGLENEEHGGKCLGRS